MTTDRGTVVVYVWMATKQIPPKTELEFNESLSLMDNVSRSRFQAENWNKINNTSIMEDIKIKLLFNAVYSYNYVPEFWFLKLFEKEYFVKKF
jgi:hypothetical protein